MKVYKEKQFLIFELDDGSIVKYDFSSKSCIGKSGKTVKRLNNQLSGLDWYEILDGCTDRNYADFLRFVKRQCFGYGRHISNLGTILSHAPSYAHFEQWFAAGFADYISDKLTYKITDVPKSLLALCKEKGFKLTDELIKQYKVRPDDWRNAFTKEYNTLTIGDIYRLIHFTWQVKRYYGERSYEYNYVTLNFVDFLLNDHHYTVKGLVDYMDYLMTYEALDNGANLMRELGDYVDMMSRLSPRLDKYPRHFLTTMKIASRNYARLKIKFNEDDFARQIKPDMEYKTGDYVFVYPKTTQDIKNEAAQQQNCVASYIQKVLDGQCDILFLRNKNAPNESLVTIEVRNGRIVQAKQKYNREITADQQAAVDAWNRYYKNKLKSNNQEEIQ